MKILNRYTKEVIYENKEISSIKLLVEEAVSLKISLKFANLVSANLRDASLVSANLEDANLRDANLRYASLRDASLRDANLEDANLRDANLVSANLRDANLEDANLRDANLRYANLEDANLVRANLRDANLRYANLEDANLRYANLEDANLVRANLPSFLIVPETGSFYAYKKLCNNVVVKIEIPHHARRTNSLIGRKCRTDEFTIIRIIHNPNNLKLDINNRLQSTHYKSDGYYLGGTFKEPNYNDDIRLECTEGLHFFMTIKEAREW